MNTLYISQSQGLGDYIVCNALIRQICKTYQNCDKICLFVTAKVKESVAFMYHDIPNIDYIVVGDEYTMMQYINQYNITNIIYIGLHTFNKVNLIYDYSYYHNLHVNFEDRWNNFYVQRDLKKEKQLFDKYNLENKKYIFLHEDVGLNFVINRKLIPNNIDIFLPDRNVTNNIFDYLTIIENAQEIHVIMSCFMFLIDSIKTTNKLYAHRYARGIEPFAQPSLKRNWVVYYGDNTDNYSKF